MLQRVLNNMNKLCLASMCDPEVEELVPTVYVMSYRDARSFLQAVGPWLRANPKAANTILPHSEMLSTLNHHQSGPSSTETHWIACWSLSSPQPSAREDPNGLPMEEDAHPGLAPQLCLVLMAAESCSGSWPVFLFSPSTPHPHTQDGPPLAEAVNATVSRLLELRPPQRTCSIFGPAPLVAVFSTIWEAHSIHPRQQAPLQRTKMLGLQNARAIHATIRVPRPGNIRAATESDIAVLINLLQLTSPLLPPEHASSHAFDLVNRSRAWVSEVQDDGENSNTSTRTVVSLCEVGRRSSSVAVITNLVTAVAFRGKGHATDLLCHVSQCLFNSGITDIIVYVGSDTSAPDCIFRKLGYEVVDDAEWIEWAYEGVNAVPW